MTNRSMPSEEYRRKLRDRHILEAFCLFMAAGMLILSVIYLMNLDRSLWVPETSVVLGGILNYTLAIRVILTRAWVPSGILFLAGCACFGALAYLNWT